MNYAVIPADIQKFGDQLANDFGPRADTILANVNAAKVPIGYFGLIPRAVELFTSYDDLHNQLVEHATSIAENVKHAADRFRETAATYASTDEDGRKQMDKLADDLGHARGTDLDPGSAPKPAEADGTFSDMSNNYYDKPGERTDYRDRVYSSLPGFGAALTKLISDWDPDNPDAADVANLGADWLQVVETAMLEPMAFIGDPIGYLVSNGLGFLIKICTPFKELLDTVATGNPDGLKACSSRYADIGKDLERLATDLVGAAHAGIPYWEGDAATAASAKMGAFVQGIHGTASVAGSAAGILQLLSLLSQTLEDIVLGLIGDFFQNLIAMWLTAIASSVPTAGASTATAATETEVLGGQTAVKVEKNVEKATSLLKRIKQLCDRIAKRIMHNDYLRENFLSGTVKKLPHEKITPKELRTNARDRVLGTDKTVMPNGDGVGEYRDPAKVISKVTGYAKTMDTTFEDFSTGTDESDEEIDQQLDFGK